MENATPMGVGLVGCTKIFLQFLVLILTVREKVFCFYLLKTSFLSRFSFQIVFFFSFFLHCFYALN